MLRRRAQPFVNTNNLKIPLVIFASILLVGCRTAKVAKNRKLYRHSKDLAVYGEMSNELQDDIFVLKENYFFRFYRTLWLGVDLKLGSSVGRYHIQNDTIYLNWIGADPKTIRPYLSRVCLLDSSGNHLSFLDDITNQKVQTLNLRFKAGELSGK